MNEAIKIIDFREGLEAPIRELNYEWLEKYFKLEASDILSLSDPKTHIIDKGGFIYYASLNGEMIGTASLLKKSKDVFELGKMAVSSKAQGLGIGTLLLEHCIYMARKKGIKQLILYSNKKLLPAIHLYTKYGFKEIELEDGLYERADIKMLLRI